MIPKFSSSSKGQALVEFALILVVLLLFIFIIIESGRLFQGYLTVQNAARSAGRYAMTGQFETDCLFEFPACLDARVTSIKRESRRSGGGLNIDDEALAGEPDSYVTEVYSQDDAGNWIPDDAGGPGEAIRIIVRYQMPVITPLLRPLIESVRLTGRVVVAAENFDQYGVTESSAAPPNPGNPGPGTGPPEADVTIIKSGAPDPVIVNERLDYTITVWNLGTFDAEQPVTVVDTLPPGNTYVTYTADVRGTECTEGPTGTVTCIMPDLDKDPGPNNSATVILQTLAPGVPGVITNTARVDAGPSTIDPVPENNVTTASVMVRRYWADLSVSITDIPDPVREGGYLTYTVQVSNRDYEDATGVVMTSTLSPDTTFDSVSPLGTCGESGGLITCNFGDLAAGADIAATIVVTANSDSALALPRIITMTASVAGNEFDPNLPNTAVENTSVADAWADLSIQKRGPDGPIPAGTVFQYILDVSNLGPDPVITATITDILPDGLIYDDHFTSSSGNANCLSADGVTIICTLGSPFGKTDTEQIVLDVRSSDPGVLTNRAEIAGNLLDPYLTNNDSEYRTSFGLTNLAIKKYAPAAIDAGDTLTYTVVVTNLGPAEATGVWIVDILPQNLEVTSRSPELTCLPTADNSQLNCGAYTIPISDTVTVIIAGIAPDEQDIVNQAYTYHDYPDLNDSDNSVVVTTTTTLVADLELSKFAFTDYDPANFEGLTGETMRYLLQISSLGPSPADGIFVTDTLPLSVEYSTATPEDRCQYLSASHQVECDMGGLVLGPTINIWIEVTPTLPGLITNTAVVTGAQIDYVQDNNTNFAVTRIMPADLKLQKFATPSVLVSDTITYTLVISNAGPSVATEVIVTDTLPISVTSPSAVTPQGSCDVSGAPVTCAIGTLAVGDIVTITMTATASAEGEAVNEASARAKETEEIDVAQATTTINPVTDLAINKVASGIFFAGEPLTYTLTITNYGPSVARAVRVTDTLPAETRYLGVSSPGNICSQGGGIVTCTIDTIPRNGTDTITISTDAGLEGIYSNVADVGGNAFDPDDLNNSTTITTTILPAANLNIVKSASGTFYSGEPFEYTLVVTNGGPSTAVAVVITDSLPADVVFLPPAAAGCQYFAGPHEVVCGPFDLNNGGNSSFTIDVTTVISGNHTNNAETRSTITDLYPADNTTSLDTFIRPVANLAIEKANVSIPAIAGDQHTYVITVTNNGPNTASGVTVTDTLPAGMTYDSATVACAEPGGVVSCTLGTLAVGVPTSFELTVDVASSVADGITLTNVAYASANEADRDLSDNEAKAETPVIRLADMTIEKSDDGSPAIAGNTYTYEIVVTNDGPSDASFVTVTDTLPALTSYAGSSISCVPGPIVSCLVGDVANGESYTFTLTLRLEPSMSESPPDITNWAYVFAAEQDPDGGNNSASESTTVVRSTDLRLQKSDDGSPAIVEENYTYTIVVNNDGPSDASGVTITDTLPPDTSYVDGSPGCSGGGRNATCFIGDLAFNGSATVTITMRVEDTAIHGTTLTNTAIVGGNETDPNSGNNSDDEGTVVLGKADLRSSKTDFGQTAIAGGQFVYQVTVYNDGPSEATTIEVTDTLPQWMSYVGSSDGCSAVGQTVTCFPNAVGAGLSTSFMITVSVAPSATHGITVTNDVTASSEQYDPDPTNDDGSDDTYIIREADLAIVKTDTGSEAVAGSTYTYTISVTNNGLSDASTVVVTDTLPAGTGLQSSTNGICRVIAGLVIECSVGDIGAGLTELFDVIVSVDSGLDQDDELVNVAAVDGTETDPVSINNTSTVTTTVDRFADLRVVKRDEGVNAVVDEEYTYRIEVFNDGPSDASGVTLTDTLPISTSLLSAPGCTQSGGLLTCIIGPLIDGASVPFTVTVRLGTDIRHNDFITNTAYVSGDEPDPGPGPNTASVSTQVTGLADLAVSKTDNDQTAYAGDEFFYEITVTNNGPSDASGVFVVDTLPAMPNGMTYSGPVGSCGPAGSQTVTCQVGDLPNGASTSFFITVTVSAGASHAFTVTNSIVVDGDQIDRIPGNNTATDDTWIERRADLAIAKSGASRTGAADATAGENYTYTLTVNNLGLADSSGVMVTDTLPSGVDFVSSAGDICARVGPNLTCTLPNIPANGNFDFSVTVFVTPSLTTGIVLVNRAGVYAIENDPAAGNNWTSLDTTVVRQAELQIRKEGQSTTAVVGEPFTYTLWITNTGPSYAGGVVVTDTLPLSTTYLADTAPFGCDTADPLEIYCDLGELVVDEVISFTLKLLVDADVAHGFDIFNRAAVGSDEYEEDKSDNVSIVETMVERQADVSITKSDDGNDAIAGGYYTYTVSVRNAGPSDASNVVVTDTLPAHSLFESDTAGACVQSLADPQKYRCDLDTLASGATNVFSITVRFLADTPHSTLVTNTVEVVATEHDLVDNNSDLEETTVVRESDLLVSKADNGLEAIAGNSYVYTVTVDNAGLSDATGVVLTDTLPAFMALSPAPGSAPAGCFGFVTYIECQLGTLPAADGPFDLVFTLDVDTTAPSGTVTNTVDIKGIEYDPDLTNNRDEEQTTVGREADLAIVKSDRDLSPVVGEIFTYAITITNNGPSLASGIVVTDQLPSLVTFVDPDPPCSAVGSVVTCTLAAPLPAGQATSLLLTVEIGDSIDHGTPITNTAGVTAVEPDPDISDNVDSESSIVLGKSDLAISKAGLGSPIAGEVFTYTVVITNAGPSDATGVTVIDTLPLSTTFAASTDGCSGSDRVYTCTVGSLANTITTTFDIGVTVDSSIKPGTVITNEVALFGEQEDLNPLNNTAIAVDTVGRQVSLTVDKRDDNSLAIAGEEYTFTIDVYNGGPSDAANVVVTDVLPANTRYIASTVACPGPLTGPVDCALGDIASGGMDSFDITVAIDAGVAHGTTITNTASVSSDEIALADQDEEPVTVNRRADLGVVKSDNGRPAAVGQNYTYTITVSNNGPSDASGVVITDTLPMSTSVPLGSLPAGCTSDAATVSCDLGDLAVVDSPTTLQLTLFISDTIAHGTSITNTVRVRGNEFDDISGNDVYTLTSPIVHETDLSIAKNDDGNDAIAGRVYTYTINVSNIGLASASGIVVTDTLPLSTTFKSAIGATCAPLLPLGLKVICNLDDLDPGGDAIITLSVNVDSSVVQGTFITNTVAVDGDIVDIDTDNNTADVTTNVDRIIDLAISKDGGFAPAVAGGQFTYDFTVSNNGDSDASGVVVTDTLPVSMTYFSSAGGGCAPKADNKVQCDIDTLASGEAISFSITVDVLASVRDGVTITNTATIIGIENESDADKADNTADEPTLVVRESDLKVTKSDSGLSAIAGKVLTYTITVENTGLSDASGIVFTDSLPAQTGNPASSETCVTAGGDYRCDVGDLIAGASKVMTFSVELDEDIAQGTVITNTVTVAGNETDPGPEPNTAVEESIVSREVDLAIAKAGTGENAIAGEIYTYTLTVTNTGPSVASGIVVTDLLPGPTTFITSTDSCTDSSGTLTCSVADLAVNDSDSFEIIVEVDSSVGDGITITNEASVGANEFDSNDTNDTAILGTLVERRTDLQITKSDSGLNAVAGSNYLYTVVVRNNGPSDATGVAFTDALPVSTTLVTVVPDDCSESNGVLDCTIGPLARNGERTYNITVHIDEAVAHNTVITNSVEVSGVEVDLFPLNDTADEPTTVVRRADLAIGKSGPASVLANDTMTYTLVVTNIGPSLATDVTVSDTLPGILTDILATSPEASCGFVGSLVTCTLAELAVDGTATITIQVRPTIDAVITNTASVEATEYDPVSGNNTASATVTVLPSADLSVVLDADSLNILTTPKSWFTITLYVSNAGPSIAQNVVLTETLTIRDDKLNFDPTNSHPGCTRIAGQSVVICDLGTIAPTGGSPVVVEISLNGTEKGVFNHTGEVGSTTADPDPVNNAASGFLRVE